MRIKQRNLIWLGMLGTLTGLAVFSQGLDAPTSLVMLGALGVAGAVSLFDLKPQALIRTMQEKTVLGGKISADAREANDRAKARGRVPLTDIQLLDIGLIALRENYDGLVMQRTRNLSLDDKSVRPYLSLQVPALEADRRAMVRFEIDDANGKKVYIHEQEMYMRDGKMDILAEMQMPLFDSDMNLAHGDGDLRVYLENDLLGVLGFSLTPSTRDRWAGRRPPQIARERLADNEPEDKSNEELTHDARLEKDDEPMTLEELLRQQERRR